MRAAGGRHRKRRPERRREAGHLLFAGKLLDFGIAKLLQPEGVSDEEAVTMTTSPFFTPEYASPEQVCGDAVTTATDIYSLGVVLYELLTGRRPYRLTSRASHEVARVICEQDPVRPNLGGDVDAMVLKALRKEPEQRYASVEQFSEDIRRHLVGLPVIARRGTLRYRVTRFAARNRLGLVVTLMLLMLLTGGIFRASSSRTSR